MAMMNISKSEKKKSPTGAKAKKGNASNKAVDPELLEDALGKHAAVVMINKRIRGAKKKLEKIKTYEVASKNGKALDEQQIEVLSSRPTIEKLLSERMAHEYMLQK